MTSGSASYGDPSFATPAFVEEFWAPCLRFAAYGGVFIPGMKMLGEAHMVLPESARLKVLRVLAEQAGLPWLDFDERAALNQLVFLHIQGAERVPIPDRKGHLARMMVQGGLVTPVVRVLARPPPEGLSPTDRQEIDHSCIYFLYLLALAVSSALSGKIAAADAKPLLREVKAAVLAHSPWIWTGLCGIGSGRPLNHDDDGLLGIAALLFAMLAGLSSDTYAAAQAADGESMLREATQRFMEMQGNHPGLQDHSGLMVVAFKMAAQGPTVLRPLVCDALYPELRGVYTRVVMASNQRWKDLDERMAKAQKCAGCHRRREKTKTCSGCQAVRYCSHACQTSEWPSHKEFCKKEQAQRAARSSGGGD